MNKTNESFLARWKELVKGYRELSSQFRFVTYNDRNPNRIKAYAQKLQKYAEEFAKEYEFLQQELRDDDFAALILKYGKIETLSDLVLALQKEYKEFHKKNKFHKKILLGIENMSSTIENHQGHLQALFGIQWEELLSEEERQEYFQILVILYQCSRNFGSHVLSNLRKSSYFRFKMSIEKDAYSEPIQYLFEKLFKKIVIGGVVDIEVWVGFFRYGSHQEEFLWENIKSELSKELLKNNLIDNLLTNDDKMHFFEILLKEVQRINNIEVVSRETPNLFWKAYSHFLLLEVEDGIVQEQLELNRKDFYEFDMVKRHQEVYSSLIKLKNREPDSIAEFLKLKEENNLVSFLTNNSKILVERLYGSNLGVINRKRYFDNKIEKIVVLAMFKRRYWNQSFDNAISLAELLYMIYLFEYSEIKKETLTKRKMYKKNNKNKSDLRIKSILNILISENKYNSDIENREEEMYELFCFMNTVQSLMRKETEEIVIIKRALRHELFKYMKNNKMLMKTDQKTKITNFTEVAKILLLSKPVQNYYKNLKERIEKKKPEQFL